MDVLYSYEKSYCKKALERQPIVQAMEKYKGRFWLQNQCFTAFYFI